MTIKSKGKPTFATKLVWQKNNSMQA